MKNINEIRNDFPILGKTINDSKLVYLDNAATTQKPKQVIEAISNYYENYNANISRSVYTLGAESEKLYIDSKKKVANFIEASSYEEIIYTSGTTESINFLARMLESELTEGDEIILSYMEHHANIVPWQQVAKRKNLVLKYIDFNEDGKLDLKQFSEMITEKTKIVSLCHASNVLGTINPVEQIGEILADKNIYYIVDAAQSVPHLKIDVQKINCDFLAFSGHKMLGPTGIGVLYGKKSLLNKLEPAEFGGGMIGIVEEQDSTWASLPDKFEAGTPLLAQAVGLAGAIDYIDELGLENIEKYTKQLTDYLYSELKKIDGITLYGPKDIEDRVSLVSFNLGTVHPHDLATFFDEKAICIRAGHQCTQLLLKKINTYSVARASIYFYNTKEEVDLFIKTLKEIKEFFDNEF